MLRYDTKSWWKLIFQFHEGDTLRTLLPNILIISMFTALVVYFNSAIIPGYLKYTATVHNLFGFVISLLLVFRTNTAYDRWWEGRRFWGALINTSRNIALKCHSYLDPQDGVRETIAFDIANFAETLKDHLRGQKYNYPHPVGHSPSFAVAPLLEDITVLNREGYITEVQFLTINSDISALSDICGGCERIKNTPIPFYYHVFIKKFVFFNIFTMPFVFAAEFGYWTILITGFMFYVLASLEILAEEIENPFGQDTNDLPLEEMAALIKGNAYDILIGYPIYRSEEAMTAPNK